MVMAKRSISLKFFLHENISIFWLERFVCGGFIDLPAGSLAVTNSHQVIDVNHRSYLSSIKNEKTFE